MVGIVERIQQIFVEGMYILKTGKTVCFQSVSVPQSSLKSTRRTQNQRQFFSESLLSVFDLASIEISYPGDLKTTADLSR